MPLAPPEPSRHRTKQEFVYRTLRNGILQCELQPSERLVIDDLARRLDVSAIPVREALQLLQSEGLVVTVPHVGTTVAPISPESIVDVFSVLEGLETVATRLVAERADRATFDQLQSLVEAMDRALAAADTARWAEANRRFHLAVASVPALPLLRDMTERVLDRWDRVRRFYVRGVLEHRAQQAQREHREMLDAMREKDLPRLQQLVRDHNQGAMQAYLTFLGNDALSSAG
ncbi:MAG TPA: GntR family transcriptional regulator [Vicinamibacterales bacterium]|nr:GntR family transcriptional regulator [Vicinamibacterales bacterium]